MVVQVRLDLVERVVVQEHQDQVELQDLAELLVLQEHLVHQEQVVVQEHQDLAELLVHQEQAALDLIQLSILLMGIF